MGKTSTKSRLNLPGRYAWAGAELIGPLNLAYILFTLPEKLRPQPNASTSFLGTGLPAQNETMALLYLAHYLNRAVISPLYINPSMSPIHPIVTCFMVTFQYLNSTSIATWLVYSDAASSNEFRPILTIGAVVGFTIFALGLAGNIWTETRLFDLRRGAAKRKAKSEGKAVVSYDKVYVIPPAEGFFKQILCPHYALEWFEWTGYWILGGAWSLGWGWKSAGLWFVLVELSTMAPRAYQAKVWYEQKFGKVAVGGRAAVIPGIL
jgi:3-oxo-5-alpha-steroid 4-dehydrogenase 1